MKGKEKRVRKRKREKRKKHKEAIFNLYLLAKKGVDSCVSKEMPELSGFCPLGKQ